MPPGHETNLQLPRLAQGTHLRSERWKCMLQQRRIYQGPVRSLLKSTLL